MRAESTCPAMTRAPNGSPASDPPSHQPTRWTFSGTTSSPPTVLAGSTGARSAPGSSIVVGTNLIRWLGAGVPTLAGGPSPGAPPAVVLAGAVGPPGDVPATGAAEPQPARTSRAPAAR